MLPAWCAWMRRVSPRRMAWLTCPRPAAVCSWPACSWLLPGAACRRRAGPWPHWIGPSLRASPRTLPARRGRGGRRGQRLPGRRPWRAAAFSLSPAGGGGWGASSSSASPPALSIFSWSRAGGPFGTGASFLPAGPRRCSSRLWAVAAFARLRRIARMEEGVREGVRAGGSGSCSWRFESAARRALFARLPSAVGASLPAAFRAEDPSTPLRCPVELPAFASRLEEAARPRLLFAPPEPLVPVPFALPPVPPVPLCTRSAAKAGSRGQRAPPGGVAAHLETAPPAPYNSSQGSPSPCGAPPRPPEPGVTALLGAPRAPLLPHCLRPQPCPAPPPLRPSAPPNPPGLPCKRNDR